MFGLHKEYQQRANSTIEHLHYAPLGLRRSISAVARRPAVLVECTLDDMPARSGPVKSVWARAWAQAERELRAD